MMNENYKPLLKKKIEELLNTLIGLVFFMVFKKINDTVKSVSLILLNKLLTLIHIYIIVIFFF